MPKPEEETQTEDPTEEPTEEAKPEETPIKEETKKPPQPRVGGKFAPKPKTIEPPKDDPILVELDHLLVAL